MPAHITSQPASLFHAERALFDAVTRLEPYRAGRAALQLHLSALRTHRRHPHHRRIALETFESHVKMVDGTIYPLASGDIMFLTDRSGLPAAEAAVARVRALFGDDPLLQGEEDRDRFCTRWDCATDYEALAAHCRDIHRRAEQSRSVVLQDEAIRQSAQALRAVSPELLGQLESAIAQADLGNLVRGQTVCTLTGEAPLQPVFREYFVSVEDLQANVAPGTDLAANRWLFQYLTLLLDRRMMAHITREPQVRDGREAFSLNMNVASVLSPAFQKFDGILPGLTRGRLVLELQLIDIFSDLGAYAFARDYLQERGYRVCIDGLTHLTLRYVDRAKLGADLVKLYWTPDGLNTLEPHLARDFAAQLAEVGLARAILCRCEDERAVELGREAGLIMFQGRYVERLYNFQRTQPRNAGQARGVGTKGERIVPTAPAVPTLIAER